MSTDPTATSEALNDELSEADLQQIEGGTPEADPSTQPPAEPNGDKPKPIGRNRELALERDTALEIADHWRAKYLESQAQTQPIAAVAEPAKPQRDQFEDDDSWADAIATWAEQRAERTATLVTDKRLATAREEERLQTLQGTFQTRSTEFAKAHPDYEAVISNPALKFFNGAFLEATMSEEKGPEILYHIGSNADLAAKLSRQSVPQLLTSLGRISAELSNPKPLTRRTPAPPPPTPITGNRAAAAIDESKLTGKELLRVRLEQRAARQGIKIPAR